MKTGGEIERDVYDLVKSGVEALIGGKLYRNGTRPHDSMNEDAVISFMTGIDDQLQTGILNLNVYVPDIETGNKILVKNITRCTQIEQSLSTLIRSLKSDYYFTLGSIIQTFKHEEINQHFVNCKIKFKLLTL